jgi:signal transduction histidine kinase/CheY-like chemotaxis protein
MAGCYIRFSYVNQLNTKKKLVESYMSNIRSELDIIGIKSREIPFVVRPLIGESGTVTFDPTIHFRIENQLEEFCLNNEYFVKSISVYDYRGDVFNISRDDEGKFIKDVYISKVVLDVLPETSILINQNVYTLVQPVFSNDVLVGNVSIHLNMDSLQHFMYDRYIDQSEAWPTTILGLNNYITFPVENNWSLSHMDRIIDGMREDKNGWITGEIEGTGFSGKVMSYYQTLPYYGHFFGVVLSCNISKITYASLTSFLVISVLLLFLTVTLISVLSRIFHAHEKEKDEKDRIITLLQTAYQSVPVGLIVSKQNRFILTNQFTYDMLSDYIGPNDIGRSMDELMLPSGFFERERFQKWDLYSFEKNGNEVHICKDQIEINVNNTKYIIDVFWEVTEIEKNRREAIRSEIAKSELLSRISNDFKRPIDRIKDAVVLLTQRYPKESTISYIANSVNSLSEIIVDVQDFADIEAGNIQLEEVPFDISDEIEKIVGEFHHEAQYKSITLQTQIASSAVRKVIGDPHRFRQILGHLLSNAVKFTESGEVRISVETTRLVDRKVLIKCSVEDTGRGMTKKQLKNLFSIDLRDKKDGESIGLGTIIVKKLVTIMRGTIRVASPSPIASRPEAPGTQVLFTIQCYLEQDYDKQLDYSSIASPENLNVLIITSDRQSIQYQVNYLKRKKINLDIFIYNTETSPLLINKLIIDKNRYQIVIIEASDSKKSFSIAKKIFENDLTKNCLYVLVDTYEQQGSYLKAKSLQIDYYFGKNEELNGFEKVLKANFPKLLHLQDEEDELRNDIRILVAENNSLSQTVANIVFRKLGYNVDFAKNVQELEAFLNGNIYDIIFVDLKFPPTNGFDLADKLRSEGYKFPIVAMTSTLTKDNIKDIADHGMDGYIQKPIDVQNIRQVLYKWTS